MASKRILNSCSRLTSPSASQSIKPSIRSSIPSASRTLSATASISQSAPAPAPASTSTSTSSKQGILTSLLHGSKTAQNDGLTTKSHSSAVARGKYIHEIQR